MCLMKCGIHAVIFERLLNQSYGSYLEKKIDFLQFSHVVLFFSKFISVG